MIRIYFQDHNHPHFHAEYGIDQALIEIKTGKVLQGKLPKRVFSMIEEWRSMNEKELLKAWNSAQLIKPVKRIKPLEE